MQTNQDGAEIANLINGWMFRDLGQWDKLRGLFHPDGTIEVTWFEGVFGDFVDRSARMGASDLKTKHLIGSPVVTFNGHKAVVETNAIIVADNARLSLGCSVHNRFYDLVEKRNNTWKMLRRDAIYDMGSFSFPQGLVEIDQAVALKYPREYAALAYVLDKSGFPVDRVMATRGSELEKALRAKGEAWLAA